MALLAGQPWPLKAAAAAAALFAALGAWAMIAALVALAGLGRLSADIDLLRAPSWFWYFRDDPQVRRWGVIGAGAAFGAPLLVIAVIIKGRGPSLHGKARWATDAQAREAGLFARDGVIVGRLGGRLLRVGGDEHLLVSAPTRSGKSAGVVLPTLLSWSQSSVVLDVKAEAWAATAGWRKAMGQDVFLFDPLAPQGRTARFNPLAHIDRDDPIATFDGLHRAAVLLFSDQGRTDPFWVEAPRNAFIAVALYVAQTPRLDLTLGEIVRQFTAAELAARLQRIVDSRRSGPQALTPACQRMLEDFYASSPNTFSSIRQSVTSRLALWLNPRVDDATCKSDFDLGRLRERPTTLYLATSPADLERVGPLFGLLVQQLLDVSARSLPSPGDKRQLLLLLDEFASLGRAPALAKGLAWLAGYGVRIVCVVQTPAQLRALYGDSADEIVANCGVQVYFAPAALRDARELSEQLGAFGLEAVSRSKPSGLSTGRRSESRSEQRRPLMLPHELLQMERDRVLVLARGRPAVRGRRILWRDLAAFAERWRPAPAVEPRALMGEGASPSSPVREAKSAPSINLVMDRMRQRDLFGRGPHV